MILCVTMRNAVPISNPITVDWEEYPGIAAPVVVITYVVVLVVTVFVVVRVALVVSTYDVSV